MNNKDYEPRVGDLLYRDYYYGPGYLLITGMHGKDITYTWCWTESDHPPSSGEYVVPISSVLYSTKERVPEINGYSAELISRLK